MGGLSGAFAAIMVGAVAGVGAVTVHYSEAASYLADNPAACANCHVMQGHLDAWSRSTHAEVASCNDCHAPHSAHGKLYGKARNGVLHSLAFTTGRYPDNLQINDYNRAVTEETCRACHSELIHALDGGTTCIRCHATVGHDR